MDRNELTHKSCSGKCESAFSPFVRLQMILSMCAAASLSTLLSSHSTGNNWELTFDQKTMSSISFGISYGDPNYRHWTHERAEVRMQTTHISDVIVSNCQTLPPLACDLIKIVGLIDAAVDMSVTVTCIFILFTPS